MTTLQAIVLSVVLLVALVVGAVVYLSVVLSWSDRASLGTGYYGRTLAERRRFHRTLRRHAVLLAPVTRALAAISPIRFEAVSFVVDEIAGPKGTCSEESFRRGIEHSAGPGEVYVVTQMKCGTTWMQQVVYETLMRGTGTLVDTDTALYAVSPWLESNKSVALNDAPQVGVDNRARVIKTHLPAQACPRDSAARYVYVSRHPGSCFASCVDFLAENLGPFNPSLDKIESWFMSTDAMWWGTWPDHVAGWWKRAQEDGNVLWVRFEDMKADLPEVVRRVADFLGVEALTEGEVAEIVRKCGFAYMSEHAFTFEMHPPHLLASDARLFVKGSTDRYRDIPADLNDRIHGWASERLAEAGCPDSIGYPRESPS